MEKAESRDPATSAPVPIFLSRWKVPQTHIEAVLEMYRADGVTYKCVFLTPGSEMSVLSAVRQKLPWVVFCDPQIPQSVFLEAVLLRLNRP